MKKILSLLTAITLTASGTSSVVSCGTKNDQKTKDQKQANTFATSLNGKSIAFLQQDVKTKAKDYTSTILSALKTKTAGNYTIAFATTEDGEKNLSKSTDASVGIKIVVNGTSSTTIATIKIKFTDNSNIVKANAIKAKITQKSFTIQGDTITSNASTQANKVIINAALRGANSGLTPEEANKITYSGTLTAGTPATIKAAITVGAGSAAATAEVDLSITWTLTDQQKADKIKEAINSKDIVVLNEGTTKTDYTVAEFQNEIKKAITAKVSNAYITSGYTITISSSDRTKALNATQSQAIQLTINVNGTTVTASPKLKLDFTKQSIIDGLKGLNAADKVFSITYDLNKPNQTFSSYKDVVKAQIISKLKLTSTNFTIAANSDTNPLAPQELDLYFNLSDNVGSPVSVDASVTGLKWKEIALDNTNKLKAIPSNTNVKKIYDFNNKLYAYTDKGLYVAPNNTTDFALISSGTLTATTNITAIASNSNDLYIGTNAGKVYKMNKTTSTFTEVNYLSGATGTKINNIYLGQDSSSINSVAIATQGNGIFITNNVNPTQASDFTNWKTNTINNIYSITSGSVDKYAVGTDEGVYILTYDKSLDTITATQDTKIDGTKKVGNISYLKAKDASSNDMYVYSQNDANNKLNIFTSVVDPASSVSPNKLPIQGGAVGLDSEITEWNFNSQNWGFGIVTKNNSIYQYDSNNPAGIMKTSNSFFGVPSSEKVKSFTFITKAQGSMNIYILTNTNKLYIV